MKIKELLEVGLSPAPMGTKSSSMTLGQKYPGLLRPDNPNFNLPSRLIDKPKGGYQGAGGASTGPAGSDPAAFGKAMDAAKAKRQAATPADKVTDLQPVGTSGTAQQQAKTNFAKAKTDATDVPFKEIPQASTTTTAPTSPDTTKSAPSLGAASGVKDITAQSPKQGGFFSGLAQGFKQGMGMDDERGIISNLAGSALKSAGLRSTANAATGQIDPQAYIKQVLNKGVGQPQQQSQQQAQQAQQKLLPKPGQMIKDPLLGRGQVKVLPNPGGKGIKLDTTKSLGYPITIDPKDMQ